MEPIRFASIGTSHIAEVFLDAASQLPDDVEYVGCYSRTLEKAEEFGRANGARLFFDDLDELGACDEIDAVYVASPNTLHHDQAIRLLRAGKHVLLVDADIRKRTQSHLFGRSEGLTTYLVDTEDRTQLADIVIPEEDGGVLKKTGVVDVFCCLRANDEASFGGGEFIIVKCENEAVWDLLAGKGHVVSRNKKYACLYLPYHIMGVETPASIVLGDFLGVGAHPECRQVSVMAGVASRDLPAGTVLEVKGHHHSIDGLVPELWEKAEAAQIAPFYLLNGLTLKHDIKKGEPVTKDAVDLGDGVYVDLYEKGLAL